MNDATRFRDFLQRVDRVALPVVLFLVVYIGILVVPAVIAPSATQPLLHWLGLAAVLLATLTGRAAARDGHPLGLGTRSLMRDFARGAALSIAIVGGAHAIVVATGHVAPERGAGFPIEEVLILFIPAVLHEELLFRGWVFQHLARWNRLAALVMTSLTFAALHLGNRGIGPVAILNIFIAGLALGLAYLAYRSLWVPIVAHLGWNLLSGPVFGYEVSGHYPEASLFVAVDRGPELLTGGDFGIEASLMMTVMETAGTIVLALILRKKTRDGGTPAKMAAQ